MITLILGANNSGKSLWAERLAERLCEGRLVYIATMIPYGEEGEQRVRRHREQRREAGFITLELPMMLGRAKLLPSDTVLLEDVSNFLANMLFGGNKNSVSDTPLLEDVLGSSANMLFGGRDKSGGKNAAQVLGEISALASHCAHLLVVSISGLLPKDIYDGATNEYIEILRQVNEGIFHMADNVYEMREGRPFLRKGRQL